MRSYDRLLAIAPGYDEAWFRRGGALWLMERFEDALASYRKALAINPRRFGAAFNSGTALLKLERYDEALAAFERAARAGAGPSLCAGRQAGRGIGRLRSGALGGVRARGWSRPSKSRSAVIAPLTFLPYCDDGGLRRACSEAFAADQVPRDRRAAVDRRTLQP